MVHVTTTSPIEWEHVTWIFFIALNFFLISKGLIFKLKLTCNVYVYSKFLVKKGSSREIESKIIFVSYLIDGVTYFDPPIYIYIIIFQLWNRPYTEHLL